MKIIVTGGAGFIGSAVCRHIVGRTNWSVVNFDKLTYAGNLQSLGGIDVSSRYRFIRADVADRDAVRSAFEEIQPDAILNLAAESHVDRSIDGAEDFIRTNVNGTFVLLEEARRYWELLPKERAEAFRFHHVSTDEVFGPLGIDGLFNEESSYNPSSPYAASKAASDHFVRAWGKTYGLPVIVTNCSNNYGPYQYPEKLIPLMILRCLQGRALPVYGDGKNVRDWLYVEDHAEALLKVLLQARPGETYNIGGSAERPNIDLVRQICDLVDELAPPLGSGPRRGLINFVEDRPGHDLRYAIDANKMRKRLGWTPVHNLEAGLRKTVLWYLNNQDWWQPLVKGEEPLERQGRRRRSVGAS